MPANILHTDRLIPRPDGKTQAEFNREVTDCFMLLCEQLRYTLSCLGVNNFNAAAFDELARRLGVDKKQDALTDADGSARLASAGAVDISAGTTVGMTARGDMTLEAIVDPEVAGAFGNGDFSVEAGSDAVIKGQSGVTLLSTNGEIVITSDHGRVLINAGTGGVEIDGDLRVTGSVTPNWTI